MAEGSERNTELPRFEPTQPSPPEFSESAPVVVGTVVWALLLVIGLAIRHNLEDSGRGWWIWTAGAGVVLGVFGSYHLRRRQARLLRQGPGPRTPDRS